jgi:hypothetical protein
MLRQRRLQRRRPWRLLRQRHLPAEPRRVHRLLRVLRPRVHRRVVAPLELRLPARLLLSEGRVGLGRCSSSDDRLVPLPNARRGGRARRAAAVAVALALDDAVRHAVPLAHPIAHPVGHGLPRAARLSARQPHRRLWRAQPPRRGKLVGGRPRRVRGEQRRRVRLGDEPAHGRGRRAAAARARALCERLRHVRRHRVRLPQPRHRGRRDDDFRVRELVLGLFGVRRRAPRPVGAGERERRAGRDGRLYRRPKLPRLQQRRVGRDDHAADGRGHVALHAATAAPRPHAVLASGGALCRRHFARARARQRRHPRQRAGAILHALHLLRYHDQHERRGRVRRGRLPQSVRDCVCLRAVRARLLLHGGDGRADAMRRGHFFGGRVGGGVRRLPGGRLLPARVRRADAVRRGHALRGA